ncbi:S-layer homology domain-containing protein [Ornithinibacillus scapharcae]|uniref:S-layer homology domain-containing protein n=1 Tax=Ornithinibacillus scapharcae TaxID=1147159 RepID=UPI000225BB53|nr:S-layer homology domain-containing protein [Ornithinibacillus scapharcae]
MKRLSSLVLALFLVFSVLPTSAFAAKDDVTGHYFEGNMRKLIKEGIMGGYPDGTFKPNNQVTRAEFTSFLVRALDLKQTSNKKSFSDVKSGAWYASAISIATSNGIIGGYPDGTFKPNNKISRQEMAAMVQRALNKKGVNSGRETLTFADKASINKIFHPAVEQLLYYNIMGGKAGNKFAPKDNTTRGETAAVLDRLINTIAKHQPKPDDGGSNGGNQDDEIIRQNYEIDFSNVVDIQAGRTPKVDGAGRFIASEALVAYFLNPNNFKEGDAEFYQFLKLSYVPGLTGSELNAGVLNGQGALSNTGDAFVQVAEQLNINVLYLIAHALHETGRGTSTLASGVEVGKDKNGALQLVTAANRASLTDIKKTYNMFGIGAVDSNPLEGGAKTAYEKGWFTPSAAVLGGAGFIDNGYISDGQDTLYKMRWNPANPGVHQYATHVQWATIQAKYIYDMYQQYNLAQGLQYEVPKYENTPSSSPRPTGEAQYAVDTSLAGVKAKSKGAGLNLREYPVNGASKAQLPDASDLEIIGGNGGWYKVKVNGMQGWVSGDYVEFANYITIKDMNGDRLNVRSQPSTSGSALGKLDSNAKVPVFTDANGNPVMNGDWYKIIYNGSAAYIHGDYVVKDAK